MQEKTFVGLFGTEETLIAALEDLRKKGIRPEDMYIIAQREEDVEVFRQRTYDEIHSTPSNWLDRFIGFISGENHVRSMLVEVGFDEADLRKYEAEIRQGKWLLYVEGEPKKTVYEIHAERYSNEKNLLNRSVGEAESLNRMDNDSVGVSKDGLPKNEYRDSVIFEDRAYTTSISERMTSRDGDDNDPIRRKEQGHIGRAGGESLGTPTPSPSHLHQQRQAIVQDNQHLQSFTRHETELRNTATSILNATNDDVISLQPSATVSSISKKAEKSSATSTHYTAMQQTPNKPIIIDLRGVNKDKNEVENWLIQDEEDLT
ncbi:general stress protein [Sporosarcina saromensis]|uniref:General stress protein n=1 Tax=Sporosarcina saromensis TaxID=359365 RepID=A0ABU4G678_9BACL|nr:general stress protein [Sporosarcina saromensis]MDW0112473.1 general stress protein [Sporosarcina saromensis]